MSSEQHWRERAILGELEQVKASLGRTRQELSALKERTVAEVEAVQAERDVARARCDELQEEADLWRQNEVTRTEERDEARKLADEAMQAYRRIHALINTPRTDDFFEAVRIEAAHQVERWGVEHDAGKRAEDWITLFTYLLGKASKAHFEGNRPKLEHHVITAAAVALTWHRNMTGVSTAMRPGVAPEKWAACEEPADGDGVPACGWTGEMSQLVRPPNENGVTHCPQCGSTAIREDIEGATK